MRKLIGITPSAVIIGIVVGRELILFSGRSRSVFGLKGGPDALEKGKI
jgi:hypothetical protein